MGQDNAIYTKGSIGKVLFKFAMPAIVSMFVAELYNMVDTLYLGRVIGANGIGALIVAFPIQRLIIALSMMIAIGSSTSAARCCGEKDYKELKRIISNAISLASVVIIPLIIIIFIFKDGIIRHLGGSEVIFPYARDYISIILMGSLFQCFTIVGSYIMMALGDTKIILISTSIGAVCNIIMDYILVVAFPFGVKGAAAATVFSQIIGFIYTMKHFLKVKKLFNLSFKFNMNKALWFKIITIGFTSFIIEVEDGFVVAALNNLLASNAGDIGVAIIGIISKVSMFMYITVIGLTSSMQPIAAYNFGAKDYNRLNEVVKKTITAVIVTSVIIWGGALLFSKDLIGLFIKDNQIINEAAKAFKIMIAAYPLLGIYYVTIYYYQALGRAKLSFCLSISKQILMVIPLSFILVSIFQLGAIGVWISYPIADVAAFLVSFILLKKWRVRMDLRIQKMDAAAAL